MMSQTTRPYIWEGLSPQERERLWSAASRWWDRATADMEARAQQDREARRQARQAQQTEGEPAARRRWTCARTALAVSPAA